MTSLLNGSSVVVTSQQKSIGLMRFVETMKQVMGRETTKEFQSMQPGDVVFTVAYMQALEDCIGFDPAHPSKKVLIASPAGIRSFTPSELYRYWVESFLSTTPAEQNPDLGLRLILLLVGLFEESLVSPIYSQALVG